MAQPRDRPIRVVAVILCALAFSNALDGNWVYDDKTQIVENRLIQDSRLYGKALVSDVWAFHGDKGAAWSNYWRPMFELWLIVNYRLFGGSPTGWHVASIIAHMAVTLLVFRVLATLGMPRAVCAAVTWVFAVHPVHTESVTWISGVTDILLALFLLSSYLVHLERRRHSPVTAPLLFLLALFSKEAAVVFPLIIAATHWIQSRDQRVERSVALRSALRGSIPFFSVAAGFIVLRYLVLHQMRATAPGAPDLIGMLGTIPSVFTFYVRQVFFPVILGPDNPLRPITNANIGLLNFALPIAVCLILLEIARRAWRKEVAYRLGLVWFLLPLILALDTRVFLPDQIVNNRYLYLPVMGAWLLVASAGYSLLNRIRAISPDVARRALYAAGLLVSVGMIFLTRDYNRAWASEVALWERGTRTDPQSGHAYAQLGEAYRKDHRLTDAKAALQKALDLDPNATAPHVARGIIAAAERRFDDAERDFKKVLAVHPDYAVALDQLAACYQQQGRFDDAISVFRDGINRMPYNRARYTMNIAVLHVMARRKGEALAALESIRPDLEAKSDPTLFKAWFYLGELYREAGRPDSARSCYDECISRTADAGTLEDQALREQCIGSRAALPSK